MEQFNSTVNTHQMQWAETPDISEITPFESKDEECFREIRDVLKKHNALDRFGLSLIHKHFEIEDDEVMIEFTDLESRSLIIKPVKKSKACDIDTIVTNWKLTEGEGIAQVVCTCGRTSQGHNGGHMSV